jgi:hypothetical protein
VNYDRLVVLKNKYDPTNVFRHDQNIKPTEQGQHSRYATISLLLGGRSPQGFEAQSLALVAPQASKS